MTNMTELKQGGKEKDSKSRPRLGDIIESKKELTNMLEIAITKNKWKEYDWERVKALINAGADTETKNLFHSTALMIAASEGRSEVCEFLIGKGAKVDGEDPDGRTALMYAAANGWTRACSVLVEHGADIWKGDNLGRHAIHFIKDFGGNETFRYLMEKALWDMGLLGRGVFLLNFMYCIGKWY
jgi:ankyrin repeat protein